MDLMQTKLDRDVALRYLRERKPYDRKAGIPFDGQIDLSALTTQEQLDEIFGPCYDRVDGVYRNSICIRMVEVDKDIYKMCVHPKMAPGLFYLVDYAQESCRYVSTLMRVCNVNIYKPMTLESLKSHGSELLVTLFTKYMDSVNAIVEANMKSPIYEQHYNGMLITWLSREIIEELYRIHAKQFDIYAKMKCTNPNCYGGHS